MQRHVMKYVEYKYGGVKKEYHYAQFKQHVIPSP